MRDDGTPPPPPADPPAAELSAAEASAAEREADFDDFGALDADITRALDGLDAALAEPAPTEAAPTEAVSTEAVLTEAVPTQTVPTQTVPTQTVPTQTVPTQTVPTQTVPTQTVPTQTVRAHAAPIDAFGADAIPVDASPVDASPADASPVDASPVDATPADASPVDATPADASPVDASPVDASPVDASPVDASPADASPADASPVDASPVDATPADAIPVDAIPADAIPANATPANAIPADAIPADATPADAIPAAANPADARPADFDALDADTIDFEDAHPDDDGCEDRELDSLVGAIPWDDEPRRGPLRIAIAGGCGGVGRTLLAANVALSLARAGRRCALVDLDPIGAGLHTALGLPPLLPAPAALFQAPPRPAPEPVPGVPLHLLRSSRPVFTSPADPLRAELLEAALDRTDEVLLFDLGPGADPLTLDTWLAADVPVIVADPLPATIERAYGFLRAALWRKLLAGDEPPVRLARAVLTDEAPATDPPITGPLELMRALAARDPAAADALRARLLNFTPRLVMNRTRNRADREIGLGIIAALRCRWGLHAEALGAIDHDDTVLEAARRHRPLLLAYPGAVFSQALDPIATRLHAIAAGQRPGR